MQRKITQILTFRKGNQVLMHVAVHVCSGYPVPLPCVDSRTIHVVAYLLSPPLPTFHSHFRQTLLFAIPGKWLMLGYLWASVDVSVCSLWKFYLTFKSSFKCLPSHETLLIPYSSFSMCFMPSCDTTFCLKKQERDQIYITEKKKKLLIAVKMIEKRLELGNSSEDQCNMRK